jgi:hypothetical protein
MSTKRQRDKRETKQVRVREDIHMRLKIKAAMDGKTISELLDKICGQYLKNNEQQNPNKSE